MTHCPYCNALLGEQADDVSRQGGLCPRCQEWIPAKHAPGEDFQARPPAARPREAPHVGPRQDTRLSNRGLAGVVLAIMGTMAVVATVFALYTTSQRRSHDYRQTTNDRVVGRTAGLNPATYPGLGYLPQDVEVISCLDMVEFLAKESGRKLLNAVRNDGLIPGTDLKTFAGLQLEDIDHLAVGVRLENRLPPRITLVVRTVETYRQDAILAALKVRKTERGERTAYRFPVGGGNLEFTLWLADAKTLVFTFLPSDLDDLPTGPIAGIERFNPNLQRAFAQYLSEPCALWIAAGSSNTEQMLSALSLLGVSPGDIKALGGIQTLAARIVISDTSQLAGVQPTTIHEFRFFVSIDAQDEKAMKNVDTLLAALRLQPTQLSTALASSPRTRPLALALQETLHITRPPDHPFGLSLSASVSPKALIQALTP